MKGYQWDEPTACTLPGSLQGPEALCGMCGCLAREHPNYPANVAFNPFEKVFFVVPEGRDTTLWVNDIRVGLKRSRGEIDRLNQKLIRLGDMIIAERKKVSAWKRKWIKAMRVG